MKKLEDTPQRIYHRKMMKKFRLAHPERVAAYKRKWWAENAERLGSLRKEYYKLHKAEFRDKRAASYQKNKDAVAARSERWRTANRERVNALSNAWYHANKAKAAKVRRNYVLANPEKMRAARLRRYASRSDEYTAALAAYRAKKRRATPIWANKFFIGEAYHLAALRTKMLGFPWHVDHTVPLKSKIVCGLHTEENLRVIPGVENIKKGNRYWPHMPA